MLLTLVEASAPSNHEKKTKKIFKGLQFIFSIHAKSATYYLYYTMYPTKSQIILANPLPVWYIVARGGSGMWFVWFVLFVVAGYLYFTFSFVQILLNLFVSRPFIKELIRNGIGVTPGINRALAVALVFHGAIGVAVWGALFLFALPSMIFGFITGAVLAFLASRKLLRINFDNVSDILVSYSRYIDRGEALYYWMEVRPQL